MVMTDPIADFLTRIRNANQAKHEVLEVPASNIKKGIAEILKHEGFVKNVVELPYCLRQFFQTVYKYSIDKKRMQDFCKLFLNFFKSLLSKLCLA